MATDLLNIDKMVEGSKRALDKRGQINVDHRYNEFKTDPSGLTDGLNSQAPCRGLLHFGNTSTAQGTIIRKKW